MEIHNPFHEGELRIQQLTGEISGAEQNSAMIADTVMRGALPFLRQQPMAILASQSADGALWTSVVFGQPGFVSSQDGRSVQIDLAKAHFDENDPLWSNLKNVPKAGLLVIDLATRRRIRINGSIEFGPGTVVRLQVAESFGNCPKYIQRRVFAPTAGLAPQQSRAVTQGSQFSETEQAIISAADTCFVASAHPERGMDASHRGGDPGFVRILDDRTLRIPDYPGNSLFNTLGNLTVNPRAGLLWIDFSGKRALQATGRTEIVLNAPDPAKETGGTGRFWQFHLEQWRLSPLPEAVNWTLLDPSPYNPHRANPAP